MGFHGPMVDQVRTAKQLKNMLCGVVKIILLAPTSRLNKFFGFKQLYHPFLLLNLQIDVGIAPGKGGRKLLDDRKGRCVEKFFEMPTDSNELSTSG